MANVTQGLAIDGKDVVLVGVIVIAGYAIVVWSIPYIAAKVGENITQPFTEAAGNFWHTFFPTSEQIQIEGVIPDSWAWFGDEGWLPDWIY